MTVRDGEPRTAASTFTQLLSYDPGTVSSGGHNQGQRDSSHDDFVFEGRIHELMTDTRVGVHTVACFCQVTASLKRITFDVSFVVDDGRSLLHLVTVKCYF